MNNYTTCKRVVAQMKNNIYLQIRRMHTYNNIKKMSFLFYCNLNPNKPKNDKSI